MQVLILEDHPLYAQTVRDTIVSLRPDAQCRIAHRLDAALEQLGQRLPDLIIIDLNVPGASGLRALRAIKEAIGQRQAKLVVMSGETDVSLMSAASELGASGFIPKALPAPEQVQALSKILQGGFFFPKLAHAQAPRSAGRLLSARNLEVLALVARGESNKGIASALEISERQVKRHLQEISERLGTRGSRIAILAAARVQGLVQ
jgi:DNA-binding NarL/FixJ family response regulator